MNQTNLTPESLRLGETSGNPIDDYLILHPETTMEARKGLRMLERALVGRRGQHVFVLHHAQRRDPFVRDPDEAQISHAFYGVVGILLEENLRFCVRDPRQRFTLQMAWFPSTILSHPCRSFEFQPSEIIFRETGIFDLSCSWHESLREGTPFDGLVERDCHVTLFLGNPTVESVCTDTRGSLGKWTLPADRRRALILTQAEALASTVADLVPIFPLFRSS